MTASNTNPFIQAYPRTPARRVFQTVSDNETYLGVARELARLTGDHRFEQLWFFIAEGRADVYLQRIIDGSTPLRGYRFADLEELARTGVPALMNTRTAPRINSFEQVQESKPWCTKTGRLEFYRPEAEFIDAGENLPVHGEPSESTFFEPCAIAAAPHPALRPKLPDYVWIDGDPADLPFRGWQNPERKEEYKVARLLARARYYPGTPRGVTRMWFNGYMATPGTVQAHETRADGVAKNAETHYQALFRYGGHQSLTRSWLKPTHQTHSLVTRKSWTHEVTRGFNVDVHCVTGAAREAMARFTKAEDGGFDGIGPWRPVALGFRPTNENEALKLYLRGGFVRLSKA